MDASMERFYHTMHSLGTLTDAELDRLLCRLTHNVRRVISLLVHILAFCR